MSLDREPESSVPRRQADGAVGGRDPRPTHDSHPGRPVVGHRSRSCLERAVGVAGLFGVLSLICYCLGWSTASMVLGIPAVILLPIVLLDTWLEAGRAGFHVLRMMLRRAGKATPMGRAKGGLPSRFDVPSSGRGCGAPDRPGDSHLDDPKADATARTERCGSDGTDEPEQRT